MSKSKESKESKEPTHSTQSHSIEQIQEAYLRGKSKRYTKTKDASIISFIENSTNLPLNHEEKVYCFIYIYIVLLQSVKTQIALIFQISLL